MKLELLLSRLTEKKVIGDSGLEVQGLACHSREVGEGFLFAAMPGTKEDGKRFIPEALQRGARSLLTDQSSADFRVTQVVVPDVREALARLSAAFYGDPSSFLTVIGITGTNGKTTTSYLIESILQQAGHRVGVMGTVNYRFPGKIQPAPNTTPESLHLQENLSLMRRAGVSHVLLEVSSHALDLKRVWACEFDVALFTNLTRDHLDYHGSMEKYFAAKRLLFSRCLAESRKRERFAVINLDDPWGQDLAGAACGKRIGYGMSGEGEIRPEKIEEDIRGIRATLMTPRGKLSFASPLIGRHNLYNILAAVGVAEALQVSHPDIVRGIEKLARVSGRLEAVPGKDGIRVFVDYAHTGDALQRVLQTLRSVRTGRLIVVFGCGGDRDRGKRAVMGQAAAEGADLAVLTSDNPRTEDPLQIISEVETGLAGTGREKYPADDFKGDWTRPGYLVIPDRRQAVRLAVRSARSGDIVLIAGKGHEDYQILGKERIHFDDREEAAEALASRGKDNL